MIVFEVHCGIKYTFQNLNFKRSTSHNYLSLYHDTRELFKCWKAPRTRTSLSFYRSALITNLIHSKIFIITFPLVT